MLRLLKQWALAFLVPRPLVGIFFLPRYIAHWRRFAAAPAAPRLRLADSYPCLTDWVASTPFDPHYFYQGAWLARQLATRSVPRHVDIGSSVMMLSVMSAWVPTVFVDFRPLRAGLEGIESVAGTINALPFADAALPSLSCLHVIEHVGLGRYGDPIDPEGARRAAAELARVLAAGGRLYLSTPVGRERVCFNAHRVFAPATIAAWFGDFRLVRFSLVDDAGCFHDDVLPAAADGLDYGCGMFVFERA